MANKDFKFVDEYQFDEDLLKKAFRFIRNAVSCVRWDMEKHQPLPQ